VGATLSLRIVGDVTVIDIAGQIKLGEGAVSLRNAVRDLVAKDQKRILVNLGDVPYIDSSGVGELVAGYTTVTNVSFRQGCVGPSDLRFFLARMRRTEVRPMLSRRAISDLLMPWRYRFRSNDRGDLHENVAS
jgi:anti-anti-sigma factor